MVVRCSCEAYGIRTPNYCCIPRLCRLIPHVFISSDRNEGRKFDFQYFLQEGCVPNFDFYRKPFCCYVDKLSYFFGFSFFIAAKL